MSDMKSALLAWAKRHTDDRRIAEMKELGPNTYLLTWYSDDVAEIPGDIGEFSGSGEAERDRRVDKQENQALKAMRPFMKHIKFHELEDDNDGKLSMYIETISQNKRHSSEEGGSFKQAMIDLGYEKPELRPEIRRILEATQK